MALVLLPNTEALVSAYLRAQTEVTDLVAGRVYTAIPLLEVDEVEWRFPLVRVSRYGGSPLQAQPLWVDRPTMQVDAFGGPKATAHTLAETCRAVIDRGVIGTHTDYGVVSDVVFGSLSYQPDDSFPKAKPALSVHDDANRSPDTRIALARANKEGVSPMPLSDEFSSGEVLVPGLNQMYVGDVGTDFPASISVPVDEDDWLNLGYFDTDGLKPSFERTSDRVMADQSFDPLRIIITEVPKLIVVSLLQWNTDSLVLAMGGGTVTEDGPGEFTYEPPDESFVDERALLITMQDGDRHYRIGYRKVMNQAKMDTTFSRAAASMLPLEFVSLAADEGLKPYLIQTDDPAFSATASV